MDLQIGIFQYCDDDYVFLFYHYKDSLADRFTNIDYQFICINTIGYEKQKTYSDYYLIRIRFQLFITAPCKTEQ